MAGPVFTTRVTKLLGIRYELCDETPEARSKVQGTRLHFHPDFCMGSGEGVLEQESIGHLSSEC